MGGVFLKLDKNREIWVERVNEYKNSNLSQRVWCEQNGVNVSALRYWLRNLREISNFSLSEHTSSEFEFANVSITQDLSQMLMIEIQGVKLSITNNYDEILLLKLIKTLRKL